MRADHLLDLERRDVLAPAADAILDPIDEVEPAAGIESACIAGVKPQVLPGFDALLRHPLITGHEAPRQLGTNDDLADLLRRKGPVVGIEDPHLEELFEDGARAARLERVAGNAVGDDVDLGHAVALDQRHTEALFERGPPLRRDRHRHHRAQLVVAVVRSRRLTEDELGDDPETVGESGAGAANVLQPA